MKLFEVENRHVVDCGRPTGLPEDFQTGPYYRSYFENEHGEQWLFWFNHKTKELQLRGGDCGWDNRLKVVQVSASAALPYLRKLDSVAAQCLLAGHVTWSRVLKGVSSPLTFVLDMKNEFMSLTCGERLWLEACLVASREEIVPLAGPQFDELLVSMLERQKEARDKTNEKEDDEND